MHERPDADLVRTEPDLHSKIRVFAAGMARRQQRSAKVQILVRDARHGDDTLTEIWQQISTDAAEIRDVLWTYSSVELYELVVLTRGWSLDRYTGWTARAISDALS